MTPSAIFNSPFWINQTTPFLIGIKKKMICAYKDAYKKQKFPQVMKFQ